MMYVSERSPKEETFPRRRRNPSFSSSLLDSIYRSIDESNGGDGDQGYMRESAAMKKQSNSVKGGNDVASASLQRAIMIENWVEKQSVHSSIFSNSASSSSESSSGAAFSSSETESTYKRRTKPKPVAVSTHSEKYMQFEEKTKIETGGGGFTKTKLRALKIYGELKKVKQPISPGGRIASFINSIFNSGNVKKAKMCYVGAVEDVSTSEHVSNSKSGYSTSSASTFSRSCLSKPNSRAKKSSNGMKRSVRFYPVSVIIGEDSQPSSYHKCVYEQDPSLMPKPSFQKFARASLLKEELATVVGQNFVRGYCGNGEDGYGDDDESDHDAESYSSSDLFELDHPVGIGRYREELPVYETTNFRTNQAIAKGLIL